MEPPAATRNGAVRGAGPVRWKRPARRMRSGGTERVRPLTSGAEVARAADERRRDGDGMERAGHRSVRWEWPERLTGWGGSGVVSAVAGGR
jgi:hypothetical protein